MLQSLENELQRIRLKDGNKKNNVNVIVVDTVGFSFITRLSIVCACKLQILVTNSQKIRNDVGRRKDVRRKLAKEFCFAFFGLFLILHFIYIFILRAVSDYC